MSTCCLVILKEFICFDAFVLFPMILHRWISVGSDLKFDARRDLDDVGATCLEGIFRCSYLDKVVLYNFSDILTNMFACMVKYITGTMLWNFLVFFLFIF